MGRRFAGTWLLILFYVASCWCWQCRLPRHPFVDRTQLLQDPAVHEFRWPHSGNYSQIVVDGPRNSVLVGGRNHLFALNGDDLSLQKKVRWASASKLTRCSNSGLKKDLCQNHINLLVPFEEQLLVCGSGFHSPMFNVTGVSNFSSVNVSEKDAYGVCSGNPGERGVGVVTRLGDIISATSGNSRVQGPMISSTPLPGLKQGPDPIRTDQYDIKLLNEPQFLAAFDVFPEVFIFFNEKAIDRDMETTATLGRVCQTDNGGSDFVLEKGWTTYRKLRLRCLAHDKPDVRFTQLEHVIFEREADLFHGIFRTPSTSFPGTAICTFSKRDMDIAFNGDFRRKSSDGSAWTVEKNKMHFNGCIANSTSLIQGFPEVSGKLVPPGKEPTNFLTFDALSDSFYNQLMSTVVSSQNVVNFDSVTERFTHVALLAFPSRGTPRRVFFVATHNGAILKVYQPEGTQQACVLSETQITASKDQEILSLELSADRGRLYVGLTDSVMVLPTSSCGAASTESACLAAHDPTCGWSAADRVCQPWSHFNWTDLSTAGEDWKQDLTACPSYTASWSKWSNWTVCQQTSNPGGLCECRQRHCLGCQEGDCIGHSTETRSCSASIVVDVADWRLNGVVNGAWSEWDNWSACGSGACGAEFKTRMRQCDNPSPRNGGTGCAGVDKECRVCLPFADAVTCPPVWGPWTGWSVCTNTTLGDEGVQFRRRECHGNGSCGGDSVETRHCFVGAVTWSGWSDCRCDLGSSEAWGVAFRQPDCISNYQAFGDCPTHWIDFKNCPCNNGNEVVAPPAPASRADDGSTVSSSMIDIKYVILTSALTGLVCVVLCVAVVLIVMRRRKGGSHSVTRRHHDRDIKLDFQIAAKLIKVEAVGEPPDEERYVTGKAMQAKMRSKKNNLPSSPCHGQSVALLNGNRNNIDIQRNSMV